MTTQDQWNQKYIDVQDECYDIFLEKSKKYNYTFFNNPPDTIYYDIQRKLDRIRELSKMIAFKSFEEIELQDIKNICEETLDFANYALMNRVYWLNLLERKAGLNLPEKIEGEAEAKREDLERAKDEEDGEGDNQATQR